MMAMGKQEAVDKSREKWRTARQAIREAISAAAQPCAFCAYYGACDPCPLKNKNKEVDKLKNCQDYFAVMRKLNECLNHSSRILEVIEGEQECRHPREIEITTSGDDKRYFMCSLCGRHRSQEPIIYGVDLAK